MKPINDQQRLHLVESTQLFAAWEGAFAARRRHRYGMKWQTTAGKDYLVRLMDAKGRGKSLGPRSLETEQEYAAFNAAKIAAEELYKGLTEKLSTQAKLNRALNIGRVPSVVIDILRVLGRAGLTNDFRVVGTHAIFGYETMAGVHADADLLASNDVDLLPDARKGIKITSQKLDGQGLLGLLKKVDNSFATQGKNSYRAVNSKGFMVDLLQQLGDPRVDVNVSFAKDDLIAVEVPNIQWLVNSPLIEVIVIGANGTPAKMPVCDPRAFAIHKAWLSQRFDRDPVKKPRDLGQAILVVEMLKEYLPQYPLDASALKYFPKSVVQNSAKIVRDHGGLSVGDFEP